MAEKHRERVYETVATQAQADGWRVTLDGWAVPTPGGRGLVVPSAALAEAIAGEWDSQVETIDPASMPLMRLASTALDRIAPQFAAIADSVASYAATDLVCHRVQAPAPLAARQAAHWDPLLSWLRDAYGAELVPTSGLLPVAQPESALARLDAAVRRCGPFELAGLSEATKASGSLAIGLAVLAGRLDAGQAFEAAELEHSYQIEQWGLDSEAEKRRAGVWADLDAAARFLRMVRDGDG